MELFADRNRDRHLRTAAATCLAGILTPEEILDMYQDAELDPLESLLVTGMLGRHFMETDQKRSRPLTEEEQNLRRRARAIALPAFRSTDEKTSRLREDLTASMGYFFGDELIIEDESGSYRFHPGYVATLEYLASQAPKDYVRQDAQRLIEDLEQFLPLTLKDYRHRGWKPTPSDDPK